MSDALFIQVLEKYRLRWPVPTAVRSSIVRAKGETLTRILRERGGLSMGVRAALPLYRATRRMGLGMSFRQGRILSSALAAVLVCAVFAGVFTISRPLIMPGAPEGGVVVFAVGDVTRTGTDGAQTPLKVRDLLVRGDRVKTGEGGAAMVQVGETILVRLQPKSELAVDTLLEGPETGISIASGTVLARLGRLGKGRSFSVKAPTVAAAVRGTAFSVTAGAVDTVAVLEGTVTVKHNDTGEELALGEGRAVEAGTAIQERPATEAEKLEIGRLLSIPFMNNPQRAPQSEYDALAALVRKADSETDAALQKLQGEAIPMTLQEIRARYGRIDVVYLYSGEQVRGAIVGRGAMMKVLVPGRYRSIPMNSVRNTAVE
ncbi:MAG: FecR domain-containing protein [Spirochaetes bacterium]|nr:FecR domain-containing protein [Spirochaetota bacterium]